MRRIALLLLVLACCGCASLDTVNVTVAPTVNLER